MSKEFKVGDTVKAVDTSGLNARGKRKLEDVGVLSITSIKNGRKSDAV